MQRDRFSCGRLSRVWWVFGGAVLAILAAAGVASSASGRIAATAALLLVVLLGWQFHELRRDCAALKDREVHLCTTLQSISDGVLTTDPDGRICTMNAMAERFTGWSEVEARGQRLDDVLQFIDGESRGHLKDCLSRVFNATGAIELSQRTLLHARDGTERILDSVGAPICDDHGKCRGAVLVLHDMTESALAESALLASQIMFRQITENVDDIITVHDLDGRRIFQSSKSKGLFRPLDDQPGDPFARVIEQDRERVRTGFNETVATGGPTRREYRWMTPDGAIRIGEAIATLIRDPEGKPLRVLVVSRDVTERRQSDENIRKQKEFTESVLRSMPGIFFLCTAEGRILRWNRNLELMSGRGGEELAGLEFRELLAPNDQNRFLEKIATCLFSGKMDAEVRIVARGGRQVPCYITGLRIDANGEHNAMLGIGIDMSARKAAEEALLATSRRLEKQNAALGEQTRNPVLRGEDLARAYRTITEVAAKTLGVSRVGIWFYNDSRTSIRCVELYEHPLGSHSGGQEVRESEYPRYFTALAEGRVIPAHYARNDPRTRDFAEPYLKPLGITSLLDAPIRSEGQLVGVICHEHTGSPREWTLDEQNFAGSMADLVVLSMETAHRRKAERALLEARDELENKVAERTRELSEANDRLKELDRLKSEFLATMSHELRTPLNSIIGFTGILRQELPGPLNDEQKKQLGMVHFSARHLLSLINDLLDLSQIESGKLELFVEVFRVADVVDEVVQSLEPLAAKKNLKFKAQVCDPALQLQTDRKKTFQVLLNLANNAVKFTEEGEVSIKVTAPGDDVCFEVADTGIGIKPEQLGNLFQAFRQIDSSARRLFEGTGLGLYLCKQLVTMLGGSIGVQSEFGSGSCFHFTIPQHRTPVA